jgi:esterase/lipase superfamily enzyme
VDYLSNLSDENLLNQMRHGKRIIIATGQGEYEAPQGSIHLSNILRNKGIPHELEIWGNDMPHDWPTWRKMLPYFVSKL